MAEKDDELEEIEDSLQDLSIEEDIGCFPISSSTPKKDYYGGGKHSLTPNSKSANEPNTKRFQPCDSPSAGIGNEMPKPQDVKHSSVYYKLRREKFVGILGEHFMESERTELNQNEVLAVLQLDESQKILATNAMKQAFPKTLVSRKRKDRVSVYKNVSRKCSFNLPVSTNEPSLLLHENSDIRNIKQVIASVSAELDVVTEQLNSQLSVADIQIGVVRALVDMQRKLQLRIQELSSILESIYEKELQRLLHHQTQCESLCSNDKDKLNEEIETFIGFLDIGFLDIGIETKSFEEINFDAIFNSLPSNLRERCPLLYDVVDALLLHRNDGREVSEMRVKSAVHSLAILVSLKSQKIQNDFKIMFTCLCISFGAGMRFINMLNHLGMTVSWDKIMNFFDSRKVKQEAEIVKQTPVETPVILMFDNINIYRGKHKHLRLFKYIGPTMWNFTGQALLVPNTDGLDEILNDEDACLNPQKASLQLDPKEIFLESDDGKADVFAKSVDAYLLEILDNALNKIPSSEKKLKEMSESELNSFLVNADFKTSSNYHITVPKQCELVSSKSSEKSNVHILPLSLEDNSTIVGTMRNLEGQLHSRERGLEGGAEEDFENVGETETAQEPTENLAVSTTLENERRRFETEDKHFWDVFNSFSSQLSDISGSSNEDSYLEFVNNVTNKQISTVHDHLGRSLLHVAVDQGNESLTKCLVYMGLDVNSREGCGITPLIIAVLNKNTILCKFLVEAGARYSGPLFTSIPSPMCMAMKLNLGEVRQVFNADQELSDDENELIRELDGGFAKRQNTSHRTVSGQQSNIDINRSCPRFVTPVVGDVGTCKTNSAVMARSASYRWVGLCPGDLHNKGYFCEAVFKVHGSSGLHYILIEVMKRKKLTKEVFKKRKFQENNLIQVREAIRDICMAYGMAAALEFSESDQFPSQHELQGSQNPSSLLLDKFKEWISASSATDVAFQHRATAFLVYGPIQKLYDTSTAYGDGYAREVVYQAQIPIYAQLGFKNYFIEVFRHVVNFLAKWPLVTRRLLQQNSSVNLSGKEGHGIELDGFVESEVVQPLKKYVSGHTTVVMCQRLMANIDMLKLVRAAYTGKEAFDVHHTSRHSEQTSYPDQLKGAWFCLQKGFFKSTNRQEIKCYPLDKKGVADGKIPKNLISVVEKGKAKVEETFRAKLYECFPDLRYEMLL